MGENAYRRSAAGSALRSIGTRTACEVDHQRKGGVAKTPLRGAAGVLQWIRETETTNRSWAGNMLVVFCMLVGILLLASRLGLISL